MPSSSTQKYHPANNPPYQINYRAKRSGKHITCTKRRVTFQFGFSSASAIASGKVEGDCRGEEHEVVLIWSHVSGKRQVFFNGREIHMSKAAMGNTKFEHSWGMGNHVLKIVANASPPMQETKRLNSDVRQFNLFLDGMSYFDFCQIYELGNGGAGLSGVDKHHFSSMNSGSTMSLTNASSAVNSYRGERFVEEERNDEEEGVCPPISELQITTSSAPVDLFDDSYDILDGFSPSFSTGVPSLAASNYSTVCTTSYDEFSPVNSSAGGYHKSFNAISSEILCAYSNTNAPVPNANSNQPALQNYSNTNHNYDADAQDPPQANNFALVPTNNAPSIYSTGQRVEPTAPIQPAEVPKQSMYNNFNNHEDDSVDAITKSMNNLVNLDDIGSKPFKPITPNASTSNNKSSNSQSLQSMSWGRSSGRAPTLTEIQTSMNGNESSREIMRSPQMQFQQQSASYQYGNYGTAPGYANKAY
eukprot:g3468.t1 g3468   contig12:2130570-2131988(+)